MQLQKQLPKKNISKLSSFRTILHTHKKNLKHFAPATAKQTKHFKTKHFMGFSIESGSVHFLYWALAFPDVTEFYGESKRVHLLIV